MLNAASFAADVAILSALARLTPAPARMPRAPGQIRDGIRYVASTPSVRAALSALAVIGAFAITFQVSIPLLITGTFGGGPAQIGEALTAVSAGSLAGALWTASRPPRRTITAPAAAALAASMASVAAASRLVIALILLGAVGIAWSSYLLSTIATLQTANPSYVGRVMSLFAVVLVGSTPVGGPVVTALAAALSPRSPFILGATAALGGCLLLALQRRSSPPSTDWHAAVAAAITCNAGQSRGQPPRTTTP